MTKQKWGGILVPVIVAGIALSGCGIASAQNSNSMSTGSGNSMNSMPSSHSNSTMPSTGSLNPLPIGDVLLGASASPPMGKGTGMLFQEQVRTPKTTTVSLAADANAFQIAIDGNTAYVPTLQGKTYVVDLQSSQVVSHFSTPQGARIANISKAFHLLILTGATSVTAYSLPSLKQAWQLNNGGNALAIAGNSAYLSGNGEKTSRILDLKSGNITGTLPVGMIEDSVYDPQRHTLWLANWGNGDMTIVNTMNNKVVKVIHESEGGGFSMKDMGNMQNMMQASGGFMQLAVGPNGKHVYAASFSGNIMVYNAQNPMFEKDIPTVPMAKLSGLAIDHSGQYAYTTVENKSETIAVSLQSDKVVSTYPKLESNRWFSMN